MIRQMQPTEPTPDKPCFKGAPALIQANAFVAIVGTLDAVVLRDCATGEATDRMDEAMVKQILRHVCAHFGFDGSVIADYKDTWQARLIEIAKDPNLQAVLGMYITQFTKPSEQPSSPEPQVRVPEGWTADPSRTEYGVRVQTAAEAIALSDLQRAARNGDATAAAAALEALRACYDTPAAPPPADPK